MARPVAYAGVRMTIAFAVCSNGDSPGLVFYDGLSKKDQARVMVLFQKLGDTGRIASREHYKKIDGNLWEFKRHQIRMPCFYASGRQLVITHGFMKKSAYIPPEEIKRANRILTEDVAREQRERPREDRKQ